MKEYAYNVAVAFCYLVKNDQVLLIKRERPPAYHEYTVVGGKKEPGEALFSACKREVYEETGLTVGNIQLRGIINNFNDCCDFEVTTYYFLTDQFSGELTASEEGELEWCDIKESYRKSGISEYYVRISPFVFDYKGVFLASMSTDHAGRIQQFTVYPSLESLT